MRIYFEKNKVILDGENKDCIYIASHQIVTIKPDPDPNITIELRNFNIHNDGILIKAPTFSMPKDNLKPLYNILIEKTGK